ncbi:MAG: hypothetical protein UD961_05215 [Bacteroidales bacterium]|nr:hypothetical protein [Bacteroidales bacterium]
MEKSASKVPVSIILLLSGIAIAILMKAAGPDDGTIYTIGTIAYALMIAAGLAGIFTTKTEIPENKEVKSAEPANMRWIANALFILCAFEAAILICSKTVTTWWWMLQIHIIINFIIAVVMHWYCSKEKSEQKKKAAEEEKINDIVNLISNLEITITCHESGDDEEQSKTV